ncbi:transcriptional regulator TetR [Gluconobacter thailandicus F149-1 = NBRC 100600]|uniref:TetR family transcriptional regulator n=1 Tax=Gluconobacter thailandicus NBRC 3257 TaxID=1381097 RepID=A0ABQ0IZC8_GLUTH|nr:TetR family transcriptional regulator [Gluconobacter thailandicus]KXV54512.1 TetR family transcriptional regulator [Gluconobacter thailandicus]GAC89152.1 TetR family transcriptional regulator [Gluconobacter thailandicus NBRC 3255]GAD27567.1 TetR family transcriptional regulator [Gluconobacter thailandicus NBRC 3257]GAN94801.1 transcriptional regulator TetR [Gluconobacter thailandicus F149-1 = NBRC 100600]GBR60200.1 transcriptional regulator [Gluconobacter thailandicus F149-1 = NBRC 100600]
MSARRQVPVSERKAPQQARAIRLVDAVLEAALQVLATEGAQRFTTERVAERAGVSVGSLYQYFPNKAAILFRLQSDEWRRTADLLRGILEDQARSPLDRLRAVVHAFVRSECEEADVRTALGDAAPLYRNAPEAREAWSAGAAIMQAFMQEALPDAPGHQRALAVDLIEATLRRVGKEFSEQPRASTEIDAWADAMADMLCAYVRSLAGQS